MPRSTLDLVAELRARAEGLTAVALAIGFERNTEFVFAHQAPSDALATLNAAIARGRAGLRAPPSSAPRGVR